MYAMTPRPRAHVALALGEAIAPDQATSYAQWDAAVKAYGGAAVVLPGTSTPAAKYAAAIWVPQVNAGAWAQPDAYSADGQFGYYRAPDLIVQYVAAGMLTTPTPAEVAKGAQQLEQQWFTTAATLLLKTAVLAGGVYLLVKYVEQRIGDRFDA